MYLPVYCMKIVSEASASSANVGPGFDVFALALDSFKDRVTIELGEYFFQVRGRYGDYVPGDIEENLIGKILNSFFENHKLDIDIGITLYKNIPPSVGLGSSASSAVAISTALLYAGGYKPVSFKQVLDLASVGESYVSGGLHRDNLVASILGGFVIATSRHLPISITPPDWLKLIILIPKSGYGKRNKTMYARKILPKKYGLDECIFNIEYASILVKGLVEGDEELIKYGLDDRIAEPYRASLIPSYKKIIKYLSMLPIIGYFISGAGPSITILYSVENYDDVIIGVKKLVEDPSIEYNYIESNVGGGVRVWVEE